MPRFPLGRLVATPGAREWATHVELLDMIRRHSVAASLGLLIAAAGLTGCG